jgi:hypothetical protein
LSVTGCAVALSFHVLTVIQHADVHQVGDHEMDAAVDAAEEGVVGGQRWDVRVVGVVDLDRDDVVTADRQRGRGIEAEGGVSADVLAQRRTVDEYVSDLVGAVELEEQLAPGVPGADRVVGAVPAGATGVVVSAVLAVAAVPGVRQCDRRPAGVVECGVLRPGDVAQVELPRIAVEQDIRPR